MNLETVRFLDLLLYGTVVGLTLLLVSFLFRSLVLLSLPYVLLSTASKFNSFLLDMVSLGRA